jgi:hypothetical protein
LEYLFQNLASENLFRTFFTYKTPLIYFL